MKALTTHRLLDCFRKAVQEEESISENILSSAYDEFLDYLLQLAKGELPFLEKLRYLYHLEVELNKRGIRFRKYGGENYQQTSTCMSEKGSRSCQDRNRITPFLRRTS